MKHYVITIARQFGSLGRPIARELSEILGVEFYDRDIVERAAEEMGISIHDASQYDEAARRGFLYMSQPLGTGRADDQERMFQTEAQIIRRLADGPSCIIVGRCSDYILRERDDCMHIFIYASRENRMRNCVESLGMEYTEADQMIRKVDKARDQFHKSRAGFLPGDYRYKDLMIDSSLLGVTQTAQQIAGIVRARFGE